jgi:hypothetical protein
LRAFRLTEKWSPLAREVIVTIGVGFLCSDGVVLGADTEESYETSKTTVNKLEIIPKAFCHSGIVASGLSPIIEHIVPQIRSVLETNWENNINIQAQLQHLMPKIYNSEAMKAFPVEKPEDRYVDMLVACCPNKSRAALFQINSSLVTRVFSSAVVGCGPLRDIAEEFSKLRLTVDKAGWATLYVVYLAKERWQGIGGASQILKIWNDGKMEDAGTWDQHRKEKFFSAYRFLNHIMLLETTDVESSDERFKKNAKIFVSNLRSLRSQLKNIEYEHLRHKYKMDLKTNFTKSMFSKLLENKRKRNLKPSASQKLEPEQ